MSRLIPLTLLLLLVLSSGLAGQQEPGPGAPPLVPGDSEGELSIASATAAMAELTDADMDAELRVALIEIWGEALAQLEAEQTSGVLRDSMQQELTSAPQQVEQARAELASLPPASTPPDLSHTAGATARELDALTEAAETAQLEAEVLVQQLRDQRQLRNARQAEIPSQLAGLEEELADGPGVELEPEPTSTGEQGGPLLAAARRALRQARRQALAARFSRLEVERASYEGRRDLLTARQDVALRRLALAEGLSTALAARADEVRLAQRTEEARAADQALAEARGRHPLLVALATRMSELSQRALELESQHNADEDRLEVVRAQLARISAEHADVVSKVEKLGLSNALGQILRRNRAALPDPGSLATAEDASATSKAQELLLRLEDERYELTDLDQWVALRTAGVDPGPGFEDVNSLARELRLRAAAFRNRLDEVRGTAARRFESLAELGAELTKSEARIRDYGAFIDARILWVPDARPLDLTDLLALPGSVRTLFTSPQMERVGEALVDTRWSGSVADGASVLLLLLLLLLVRPIRRRMALEAERARAGMGHMTPSVFALMLTCVKAATVPLALWVLGSRLLATPQVGAAGQALQLAAAAIVPLTLLSAICAPQGLGPLHFRWPAEACVTLRTSTRRLAWGLIPLLLLYGLVVARDDPQLDASLGRALRLVFVLLLSWFLQRLLRQRGPVDRVLQSSGGVGLGPRLRVQALILGLAIMLLLVGLIVSGYQYSAQVILSELIDTAMLVVVLVLVRSMGLLALATQARRMRFAQRRRAREAAGHEGEIVVADEELGIDVAQVSAQARQLMRAGITLAFLLAMAGIWANVLPALSRLDDVAVYERSFQTEVLPEEGGAAQVQTLTQVVSLADLLGSLITLVVTFVAVRNLPGLLDIAVLSRVRLQPGLGYAIKTLTRYVLGLSGTLLVLGQLGATWESMQWLVAAMSVGLGFGLQEVFANFVSGVILLFERPVRVGDIVTVGQTEGIVTRIQMRATTIKDWNFKEMLIPNKRFVTEDVTNWTLSDPLTRLILKVGLAYGSDTELATRTLLDVAQRNSGVLKTPEPTVVFRGFGDSTLDFDLRIFINDYETWPEVTHAVNTGIDQAFRELGIEIAFPQRDVHIKVKELGALSPGRSSESGASA